MKRVLKEKLHEALRAVLPISIAITAMNFLLLLFFKKSMPITVFVQFVIGAGFLLFGIFFLAMGEDLAMIQMGDRIGAHLARTKRYVLLIICCFLMGALVMIAEPNLAVFASLHPGMENRTIIFTVAAGVGVFLVLSVLRVFLKIPLSVTLTVIYAMVFAAAVFAPKTSVSVAFDAAGVATGPITASFIMSVGIGLASVRGGKSSTDDSFGAVGICMVGPIIALLLVGIFGTPAGISAEETMAGSEFGWSALLEFVHELPVIMEEVAFALLPIIAFFVIFQFIFLHLSKPRLIRIGIGVVYAFIGHTLFLTGVFVGFLPAGKCLGELIASLPRGLDLLLIPIAMIMGGFIVHAEPAIHVLIEQVENVTVGALSKKAMKIMLTVSVAIAAGLSMLRVMYHIPIMCFLVVGYAVSIILAFFAPKMFTAIAFDSGGAATGAMTVSFMLPFAIGACSARSDSYQMLLTDAFGLIALFVIVPIITIQMLGLLYKIRLRQVSFKKPGTDDSVSIIEFETETA